MTAPAKIADAPFLCPKCNLAVPDFEIRPGLITKFCSSCKGTWFATQLLGAYLGTEDDLPDSSAAPSGKENVKRQCPACRSSKLELFSYDSAEGAPELEKCSRCQGIWLDGGKLQVVSTWVRRQRAQEQSNHQADLNDVVRTWSKHSRLSYGRVQETAVDLELDEQIAEAIARPRYGNIAAIRSEDLEEPKGIELDEVWVNSLALPLAFFLAWWVVRVAHLLNFFIWPFTIPVHEMGHALALWSGGFRATPLPFGLTFTSDHRSTFTVACYFFLLAFLGKSAKKEHNHFLFALVLLLMALQAYFTLLVSEETVRETCAFAGVGGQFYLSTLLVIAFYYPMPTRLRWDFWRFLILIWGAYNFLHIWCLWQDIARHESDIPWGSLLFGAEDANGDMDQLVKQFGWSHARIIETYVELGWFCVLVLLTHYFVFLRGALRRRRLRTRSSSA